MPDINLQSATTFLSVSSFEFNCIPSFPVSAWLSTISNFLLISFYISLSKAQKLSLTSVVSRAEVSIIGDSKVFAFPKASSVSQKD